MFQKLSPQRTASPWIALIVAILCSGVAASSAHSKASYRLPDEVRPTGQSILLRLDPAQETYSGSVRLSLRVSATVDAFALSAEAMTIVSLTLTGPEGPVETTFEIEPRDLRIRPRNPLAVGTYELEIGIEDDYNTNAVGLYRVESGGNAYLFTQFEADDAREAFPCFDEPEFKIPYQLTLDTPDGLIAVSNTPVVETRPLGEGWARHVFAETKPLPSYLLTLAVGPFDSFDMEGLGVPGRIYTVRGQSSLAALTAEITPRILRATEEYFGRPYPYEKLDFIAVPEFWPGAMEHPGAITYADRIILIEREHATVNQHRRIANIVAHEIAHQWFGNLVTLEWWDDLWLNEAFADWMGDKITHRAYPEFGTELASARESQQVMVRDARATTKPVRTETTSTDNLLQSVGIAYHKGKGVLSMFEQWIGEETFRRGVLSYLAAHEWGNAQAGDLWTALALESNPELPGAFATFIEQPGFPIIDVERLEGGSVRLTQHRFHNAGSELEDQLWRIPLVLGFPGTDGVPRQMPVFLSERESIIDLGLDAPPAWIFPKGGGTGYFRYRVESEVFQKLAGIAASTLAPGERLDFVGNLGANFDAGDLSGADYLRLLEPFGADPETEVVRMILAALQRIENSFITPDLSGAFAMYVRRTLQPAVDRFGIDPMPGEAPAVAILRPTLLEWAAEQGESERVLEAMRSRTRAYLESGTLDPLLDTALRLTARHGDLALFREFRQRFESAQVPDERRRFLSALGRFRAPSIREEALDYVMHGPLRSNELSEIVNAIRSDESGREQVFAWFIQNYPMLIDRLPPIQYSGLPRLADGCSKNRFLKAEQLFSRPELQLPGVQQALEQVREEVDACIALRVREGRSVESFLQSVLAERRAEETSQVLRSSGAQERAAYPWLASGAGGAAQRIEDIATPAGFSRLPLELSSFGQWLRGLPLQPAGTPVRLYHGQEKPDQTGCFRVLDIDTGSQDLQQCADAVIRLRAEYLFWRGDLVDIAFNFTSGDRARFDTWIEGYRPKVRGDEVEWHLRAQPNASYDNFKNYLKTVFTYAGSYSLAQELRALEDGEQVEPGDVFIQGGFPGHAMIVADVASQPGGQRALLLAQSYMPAQDVHIVNTPAGRGPWYILGAEPRLETPDWTFEWSDLRRFR